MAGADTALEARGAERAASASTTGADTALEAHGAGRATSASTTGAGTASLARASAAAPGEDAARPHRGIVAVVRDMEYRGSFYRIVLDPSGDAGATDGQSPITVDLPSPTAERLKLRKNDKLALELPPERVIRFASDKEASA